MYQLPPISRIGRMHQPILPRDRLRCEAKDGLVDQCRIGLKLKAGDHASADASFIQNYAVLSPYSAFGPKLFLHGRELFASEVAFRQFKSGKFTEADAPNLFKKEALAKIRYLFAPESFEQRVVEWVAPRNDEEYLRASKEHTIRRIKARYPDADFSCVPAPTSENFGEVHEMLWVILEKNGGSVLHDLGDDPAELEAAKREVRKEADAYFGQAIDAYLPSKALRQKAGRLKHDFWSYLGAHHYDPEAHANFCLGIAAAPMEENRIEALIETGLNVRSRREALTLAKAIDNPFTKDFCRIERTMAHILARTVGPRSLRHSLRRHTAFIIVDAPNLAACPEVLPGCRSHGSLMPGEFSHIVSLCSEDLSALQIGRYAAHETDHQLDHTGDRRFVSRYEHTLNDLLAGDRKCLEEWRRLLLALTPDSPAHDRERMRALAKSLGMSVEHFQEDRMQLLDIVNFVDERVSIFMPKGGSLAHSIYKSQHTRNTEIPAVLEELKVLLGDDFIKKTLPGLEEATRRHRSAHPGLRDHLPAAQKTR